jgi:hypothetical protein
MRTFSPPVASRISPALAEPRAVAPSAVGRTSDIPSPLCGVEPVLPTDPISV